MTVSLPATSTVGDALCAFRRRRKGCNHQINPFGQQIGHSVLRCRRHDLQFNTQTFGQQSGDIHVQTVFLLISRQKAHWWCRQIDSDNHLPLCDDVVQHGLGISRGGGSHGSAHQRGAEH
jgi:hypothetical protein